MLKAIYRDVEVVPPVISHLFEGQLREGGHEQDSPITGLGHRAHISRDRG